MPIDMAGGATAGSPAPATPAPAEVLLALGANLGQPREQLRAAVASLSASVAPLELSPVYRSAAVGHTEQADFFNLVCRGETTLTPAVLLAETTRIEERLGRRRSYRNAPRLIDIDILAVGRQVLSTPELTLPHPRLHERAFVLVPLQDVAPGWRHPILGLTAGQMLRAAAGLGPVVRVGELFEGEPRRRPDR